MSNQKSVRYDQNDYEALLASSIPASLASTAQMHFDDAEDASVFFARELDYVKSQSYDVEYPEFTALSLFPSSSEVDPGAETMTYYSYDRTGMAKIISNYGTDLPRADVKGKPTTAAIKSIGDSYGYSIQEMRASRMAGKSLDTRKAESARYQVDRLANKIAWAGDAETGLRGVLSTNNDVPLYVPAAGAGGSVKWADKTADEILADITGMMKQMARTTRKVEKADTLAMPSEAYIEIQNRRIDGTDSTLLASPISNDANFDNVLILGPAPAAPTGEVPAIGVYSSLNELTELGIVATGDGADPIGVASRVAFSQSPRPSEIYVAYLQETEDSSGETTTQSISDALANALATSGWYCICPVGLTDAQVVEVIQWTETQNKICGYIDDDPDTPIVTTGLYLRSFAVYPKETEAQLDNDVPAENKYGMAVAMAVKAMNYHAGQET